MRQRLLGILAYVVIIAASCESSILSPAPLSDTESGTPAETSATQGSNLAGEQILRVNIDAEPLSLDPTAVGAPEILRALPLSTTCCGEDSRARGLQEGSSAPAS